MQYRDFGKTGIKISNLGFGAMRLPYKNVNGKNVLDYDKSIELMQRAYELGVNYFDTAPGYCDRESEIAVGMAVKPFRDKIYISTKNPIDNDSGDDFLRRFEQSFKKLDTTHIDFYHMWGIGLSTYNDKIIKKGGPLDCAKKLKEQGLIKHISFSFHDDSKNLFPLIDTGEFETVLLQYNLLDRSNEKALLHATQKGLGTVVMGPVAGGRLGAPSEQIQKMIPGGAKSSAELAMKFVLANKNVSCALSGMSNIAQLEENAKIASEISYLTQAEMQAIEASMEENKRLSELYCTGCRYCMPCPAGVDIVKSFWLMNQHKIYGLTEWAKGEYNNMGKYDWSKGKPAHDCTECGECESKCPQKIKIRAQLKETAAALKRL